ncbi:MAG TPA: NAD-dependent epimerase/dehydratase family protein [Candidatus Acidoferrales bacterium]|nr:NAD-dependent epimerase/dehydratase family protein [Candidatus Acidoferrales bacterium]
MPKKVMVTGVAGFVGSNLAKHLLDRGYNVIGIDDLSAGTLENVDKRVEFHKLDIRDAKVHAWAKGLDAIFHLAAKASLTDCLQHPIEAASVNTLGTLHMLEAARQASVPKFVYADTSAEYEGITEFPTKEDRVLPIGVYAASKHGGWAFCESYSRLYDMNITVMRYFNVYGPAQDWRRVIPPVMSSFILRMLGGERPVIYGTGEKRRDFIYVDDVNDLHMAVLENLASKGKVVNAGTGTNLSVNEVFQLVEEQMKTRLRPVYKPDLPGEAQITLADIRRAKSLGWSPKIDVREGLRRTISYLKEKAGHTETFVAAQR